MRIVSSPLARAPFRYPPAHVACLLCLLAAQPAATQQLETVTLRWDNDILALRGTGPPPDHDYTQGLHVAAELRGVPRALGGRDGPRQPLLRLSTGQEIYTPRRDGPAPVSGERPYAGWLYAAAALDLSDRDGTRHTIALELGLTGPAALGEQVQNGFHHLVGSTPQEGWDHQLATELAGSARYRASWPREHSGVLLVPHAEIEVGTLRTGGAAGLALRAGAPKHGRGWFAEGEARQEWVARDLFLDGNTYRASVRTEKRPWVGQATLGAGFRAHRWSLEYRYVVRNREYEAQREPHGYGSLVLAWGR